jgi:hypothetical protein
MDSENKTYKVWLEIEQTDEQTGETHNMDTPGASLATFETYREAWNYAEHITRLAMVRPFRRDNGLHMATGDETSPAKDSLPVHVAKAIDEILLYLWQEGIEAFIADEPAPGEPHMFRDVVTVSGWFDGHRTTAEELLQEFYTTADRESARRHVHTFRG